MARILVTGPATVTGRDAAARLVERMRADGHEAVQLPITDALDALRTTDAVVALLDGPVDERIGLSLIHI